MNDDVVQTLDISGTPIAYRYTRSASSTAATPTLLFCHALATHSSIWDATVNAFADKANTLVFDLPGHGGSGNNPGQSFEFSDLAAITRDLLDHLGIARIHLIGVSVGGEVAQAFAALYPQRVDRLILSSTACHTAPARAALWQQRIDEVEAHGMGAIAIPTAQRWFSAHFASDHPDVVQGLASAIASTDDRAFCGLGAVIAGMDLRDANREITAPTLITFGSEDHNTGAAAAAMIASTIPGARAELFTGSGHFPHLEDPEGWNRAVDAFLFSSTTAP